MGGLFISSLLAYAISRQDYKFRTPISFFVFFTLLFNGGMVPFYIVVTRYLGLKDNILALILPYMVTAWYVLILRTSFAQLPKDLLDAGRIDGAGEWRIFFQIVIPLSKPVLATIGLFYILRFWNDWFLALLFIDSATLYPLQYLLYVLMTNITFLASNPQTTGIAIPDAVGAHGHGRAGLWPGALCVFDVAEILRTRHHDRRVERLSNG